MLAGDSGRLTLVLYRRRAMTRSLERNRGLGRAFDKAVRRKPLGVADAVIMQIEWSARALLRSARAVCPRNDEDRGSVRAWKRTERWCRARGKLGEERLS